MAETKKITNLTSASGLFSKSYNLVRKNLNVYGLVYFIPAALVIAGAIQLIQDNQREGWSWSHAFGSSFLGPNFGSDSSVHVASLLFSIVLFVGAFFAYFFAIILNLRAAQNKQPTLGSIWQEYKQDMLWLKLIGLTISMALITVAGFILLIVPGIILVWRLFLAPYVLIDKKTKIMDALSISWNMTKGHAWPIYSIIGFSFLLGLTGIIPIAGSLIAFLFGTAYAAAPALRYQELKK
jgi:hypothetical protein